MLAWYHAHGAHLFDLYVADPIVERTAHDVGAEQWRVVGPNPESMRDRGQLGDYWRAMLGRQT